MKTNVNKSVYLMLVATMLLTFIGCNNGTYTEGDYVLNSNPVTLTFTQSGDHTLTGLEEIFSLFEEKTGNKVVIEKLSGGNEYEKIIKAKFAAKDVPDLVFYYPGYAQYKALGYDQLVDVTQEPYVQEMTQTVRKFQTSNGKIYGIPWGSFSSMGIIYNKTVFDKFKIKPPQNYSEFLQICEKLKAAGIIPIYEAGKDAWPTQVFSLAGWETFVDPVLGDNGIHKLNVNELRLTEIPMLKSLLLRQLDLKKSGYFNADFINATYIEQQDVIATGEAAMIIQGEWILPEIKKKYGDTIVNELGMFPIPSDEDTGTAALYAPAQILIPAHGKHVEIAKQLVRFITESSSLDVWYKHNPGIPVYKNTRSKLTTAQVDINKFARIGQSEVNIQTRLTAQFLNYDKITQALLLNENIDDAIQQMDENYRKDGQDKKLEGF